MWKVIRGITKHRMAIAFFAGMAFTAALAYIPSTTDTSLNQLKDESAVPAPLYVPDFPESGGSHPVGHTIYELVYAPLEEAMLSG